MRTVLLIILAFQCFIGVEFINAQKNKEQTLKEVRLLAEDGCFMFGGADESTAKGKQNAETLYQLKQLAYRDLKDLLKSDNEILKIYGFYALAKSHKDSITEEDKKIFDNNNPVVLCTPDGPKEFSMTYGQFCERFYNQSDLDRQMEAAESTVRKKVSDFISSHALAPKSYNSIGFEAYSATEHSIVNGKKVNTLSYRIKHIYEIQDSSGATKKVSHWFVLVNNFCISIIESEQSDKVWSEVPLIKDWLNQYGREMTTDEWKSLCDTKFPE